MSEVSLDCSYRIRRARPEDAESLAVIYNEGIEERSATFETDLRSSEDFVDAIAAARELPLLVTEREKQVLAWAGVRAYSDRPCYKPIGESMLYVRRGYRDLGIGTVLLNALAAEAERAGYTKLIGRLFADNEASIALVRRCGFEEVGVHRRHGRLDDEWRDVLVVERLLGEARCRIGERFKSAGVVRRRGPLGATAPRRQGRRRRAG